MKSKELKIYLIAGEPSGDLLGSRIMRALKKKTNRAVRFFRFGGDGVCGGVTEFAENFKTF